MLDDRTLIQILYTAHLDGDIQKMPRIYSLVKRLRREGVQNVLVDLGGACSADVWHCAATDGRSMLIVLDGMGYTAANVQTLNPASYERLAETVTMGLVADGQTHIEEDVLCALEKRQGDGHLCIILAPSTATHLEDDFALFLTSIESDQVGEVIIEVDNGQYRIIASTTHTLTPATLPDATIAGVVDFVLGEARYYQKQRDARITEAHRALIAHTTTLLADELEGLRTLFTRHSDSLRDWEAVKQLCFLISRAANELADELMISPEGIAITKGRRTVYHVSSLADDALKNVLNAGNAMVTVDRVLGDTMEVKESSDELLILKIRTSPKSQSS